MIVLMVTRLDRLARSTRRRAPESVKQAQIHVSNIAFRRSSKCSDQDALRDRPGCIRANFGQRANDRYNRTRTIAGSRIYRDFDCSRKLTNSRFKRHAIVVGSELRCAFRWTINTRRQVRYGMKERRILSRHGV
jgi:hypothetical protein